MLDQQSLTHFPSQPWYKMCAESRGRDSPHREQSNIDAVVLQLQFDYGNMGDASPLLEPYTRRWCPTPRRWTCPMLLPQQPSGCVTWGMNAFVYMEQKKEFFSCYWTKWQKYVVLKDKTGKFYDKCHRHRATRAMEPLGKPSPQCVDLLEHIWQFSKTESRLLERQHIQREKRHTNDPVREDSWTEVQERDPATG